MTDHDEGSPESIPTGRLEARLERWFETEVTRAERALPTPGVARAFRRSNRPWFARGRTALAGTAGAIVVVVSVAVGAALVGWLGPVGPGTAGGPMTSAPGPSAPTPATSPSLLDLTVRYPDGIPSSFGGEHVYRPSDLLQAVPAGTFLLGGWDAGALPVSCPLQIVGRSNPPCPPFEGLAETRGGPSLITLNFGSFRVSGLPALVLRVAALPAPSCVSIPAGGCPGVFLDVQAWLWGGNP